MKQLMIFGDSIMKGVTFNGQKYQLCQEHNFDFLAKRNIAVQNFSKMGATVTAGLSILKRGAPSRSAQRRAISSISRVGPPPPSP